MTNVPIEPEKKPRRGRPSEYTKQVTTDAWTYLDSYEEEGDAVPTIEGLCDYLGGVSKKAIYAWEDAHTELGDALDAIRAKQGRLLQNGGLTGKFAPVITKLMLSANHGMAEKSEQKQEHSGSVGLTVVTKVPVPDASGTGI